MKQNQIKDLKSTVEILTTEELKTVRNLLSQNPFTLELFNHIKHPQTSTSKDRIHKKLSSISKRETTIQNLNKHLRLIRDALLGAMTSESAKPNQFRSESYRIKNEVRLKLIQAEIFFGRGEEIQAKKLFQYCVKAARKYEFYDLLLQALHLYFLTENYSNSNPQRQVFNQKIEATYLAQRTLNEAYIIHAKYDWEFDFSSATRSRKLDELEADINTLESSNSIVNSITVNYFIRLLKIIYYKRCEDHNNAVDHCLQLIIFLKENNEIMLSYRMGTARLYLVESLIRSSQYLEALEEIPSLLNSFQESTINYVYALELKFYALWFVNEPHKAEMIAEKIVAISNPESLPFRYDKRLYIRACVSMMKQNFQNAEIDLRNAKELFKDKSGWNVAIRITMIINKIEAQKLDDADREIQNLKKFVNENIKVKSVSKRTITIVRLLQHLSNLGFNFSELERSNPELLTFLREHPEYRWHPLTPELIIFENWISLKATNKRIVSARYLSMA